MHCSISPTLVRDPTASPRLTHIAHAGAVSWPGAASASRAAGALWSAPASLGGSRPAWRVRVPSGAHRPDAGAPSRSRRRRSTDRGRAALGTSSRRSPCLLQAPHQGDRAFLIHRDREQFTAFPQRLVGFFGDSEKFRALESLTLTR